VSWEFLVERTQGGHDRRRHLPGDLRHRRPGHPDDRGVVPLGVAAAIYLQEYARRIRSSSILVRLALQNLAGVPAIVFGLFGLGLFVEFAGGTIDALLFGGKLTFGQPCIFWAALTLAILTLPTVVVTTEEALRAVPRSYREAGLRAGRHAVAGGPPRRPAPVDRRRASPARSSRSRAARARCAPIMFTGAAYFLPTCRRSSTTSSWSSATTST
jgi:phosphate transport system permease protein